MALYPCPECKHEMRTDATACPHCGKVISPRSLRGHWQAMPEKQRNILGGLLLIILAVIALRFFGPGTEKTKDVEQNSAVQAASVEDQGTMKLLGALLLAGRSENDVAQGLGKPVGGEQTKYGPKLTYALASGATIEIVYINGMADWITMTPRPGKAIPFTAAAIEGIGFHPATPTFTSPDVIRWDNIQGLRQVSLHAGQGGTVGYFYVKVKTE